jgi:hypothetical protein
LECAKFAEARAVQNNEAQSSYRHANLSEIRLAGKWLEACGFEVGRFAHVQPLNNSFVITLVDGPLPDKAVKTRTNIVR